MAISDFEILEPTKFRIKDKIISARYHEQPLQGRYKYTVDCTSNERDKIVQNLNIYEFGNISPTDLPNSFILTIQEPRSEFKQLAFIEISKLNDSSELSCTVIFDYGDWHLPINLVHFSDLYASTLQNRVENFTKTAIDKSEAGIFITCWTSIPPQTNYLDAYRKLASEMLLSYRKSIEMTYQPNDMDKKISAPLPHDNSGFMWWLRYIIVPLIIAIIAGLFVIFK